MKSKCLFSHFFLLTMLLVITGCSKNWIDVNEDNNNITENNITAELVLPQALLSSATILVNDFEFLQRWMGYWCVPAGMYSNTLEQNYQWPNPMSDQLFNNLMSNNSNYHQIIKRWERQQMELYIGISRLMKAHNFSILVDVFNNIPYRQALQGAEEMTPEYEQGMLIYEELMKEIDAAIVQISSADPAKSPGITSADIMFHGNKESWIRFANTLKLRLLLHQANIPSRAGYISEQLKKMELEPEHFLKSREDAAVNPGFTAEFNKQNPYYERYGYDAFGNPTFFSMMARANVIALDLLKDHKDPRIGFFYRSTMPLPAGSPEPIATRDPFNYRGNQYGLSFNAQQYPFQGPFNTSAVGGRTSAGPVEPGSAGIIKGYNMDLWIITSVESLFLQAEAVARGWINGDAKAYYKAAVLESFLWLNVDGDAAAARERFDGWYEAQHQDGDKWVSWDTAPDKLQLVLFQKYLSLNGISPLESWTDYRRNGKFPDIPLSASAGRAGNPLPVRLPYPQVEFNFNLQNVKAQGEINHFTSKIWWMP